MRLRPLLAVTASLTLCLLLLAHPAAAQNSHRGHGGGEPHAMTRERADRSQSTAMAQVPRGLRAPVTTRRDAVSDYGLHASGPLALTPPTGDGARGLAAAQMNGSALNPEPVRAGSLRADIARYNAERAMHGVSTQGRMEVPHPPTAYAPNLYTN